MPGGGARVEQLEDLYRRRFEDFRRLANAIVRDRERALDVVQEAFAQALRSRRAYRGEGPLDAWVCRMIVNGARKALRERPLPALELEPEDRSGRNGSVRLDELRAPIAALPERQRLVLFLRYYADLDYRGIGEALGIETGTVGATLNAAHAALRASLEEVAG